jgi:hypothetical protein
MARLLKRSTFAFGFLLLSTIPARALDVVVKDVRSPELAVTATIDLRDPLPDRFRRLLDEGRPLHLRLQAELWQSRPVWDRLVFPAIVRVFRFGRPPSGRDVTVDDSGGSTATYPTVPNPLQIAMELGKRDRIDASATYYVHVMATLGTLAEREADDVGDAVFGSEADARGIGAVGRYVFRTMIKISDYLQSVSAEASSKKLRGADVLKK